LSQNHGEGGSSFVQHRPQKALDCPSSAFSHHCASSKGESWINWGSKLALLIYIPQFLVRVQIPLFDRKESPINNVERFLAMLRFDSREKIE